MSQDQDRNPTVAEPAETEEMAPQGGATPGPDGDASLRKAEAEAAEFKDAYLRARAETENVRKQAQTDVSKAYQYAIKEFAEDLLPVKDALELTLSAENVTPETLKSGAELTLKNLGSAFSRAKIQEVNPVGEKFDPHRHQAMQMVESNQPANSVVTVYQKGYLLNDRVLRPALVTVSKGPRSETPRGS